MTMTTGRRLGPYEILNPLGAGGMGEVYRAKDTRLDRTVAIKVLPSHLSRDPERRQRFEREARAVSAINHPNICTLHDIGHQEGIDFLVMEYIEGETLSKRLQKGALPLPLFIQYAMQIADALDKAHKNGIVHRDLKPGNIMLTKAGIKLLDFGLAKVRTEDPAIPEVSSLPTEKRDLTQEGTILGTIQYMAPEQLEGKPVDQRTDIFAFGAVLYEMATGKKAFEGTSQASVIASILKDQPRAVTEIQPMLPPLLQRLIENCLAKDPDDRWQTAHDILLELRSIEQGSTGKSAPMTGSRAHGRERLAWTLLGLVSLMTAYLLFFKDHVEPQKPVVARLSILPPANSVLQNQFAVSPDGNRIVFVTSSADGTTQLWLRDLDALNARSLPGTEGASFPFWSPDNRQIGFFAQAKLKTLDMSGGTPRILCDALQGRGGTWNEKGEIVFSPYTASPLYVISAKGGAPRPVTKLASKEPGHRFPHFLPDSEHFFYVSDTRPRAVWIGSLTGQTQKLMDPGLSEIIYASGKAFFVQNEDLYSQPFDVTKLRFLGEAQEISQDLAWNDPYAFGAFSVSSNGILAYRTASEKLTQLVWCDRNGTRVGTISEPGYDSEPVLSTNNERFAFFRKDPRTGNRDVWLGDVVSNTVSRFTFDLLVERFPVWAPDDRSLIYAIAQTNTLFRIMRQNVDGTGTKEIAKDLFFITPTDWSGNARFLLMMASSPQTRSDIHIVDVTNPEKDMIFARTKFNEIDPQFSPDTRYVAYASDESGKDEVYVQPFPQTGAKWQISTSGGRDPHWRGDGKELFYVGADGQMTSVSIEATPTFRAGKPQALFPVKLLHSERSAYDVTADGHRFLLTVLASEGDSSAITVLLNFDRQ